MATVNQTQIGSNKIRNLPISEELRNVLSIAGSFAGIDEVRVISGGQCAKGTCNRRIGSVRHDLGNAADLDLIKDGRTIQFILENERPFFEAFVQAAASLGATGIGGSVDYMGPTRLHIGYGVKATFGGPKGQGPAPRWLRESAIRGWSNPDSPNDNSSLFIVIARSGLRLRSGPGLDFDIINVLANGTVITVKGFNGDNQNWAQVDLEGDSSVDGYVFRTYLQPVQENRGLSISTFEEDCAIDNLDNADNNHEE